MQQHIGGGHQGIRQATQFVDQLRHQLLAAFAAERFALVAAHFAVELQQRFVEAAGAGLADRQFRARADQGDAAWLGLEQALGQLAAGVAVVADHRAEVRRIQAPVDGDHRQALGLQGTVAVVLRRQATGDEQCVATAGAEQLLELAFAVGLVVAAGDQQLVATGPGALFQLFGDAGVAGVLQIRENEAQCPRVAAAQAGGLGLGVKPWASTTARTRSTVALLMRCCSALPLMT